MKRLINVKRLAKLLAPSRFAISYDLGGSEITYARPAESGDLWECIFINVGGKRGESVSARVGVSAGYGLGARGLTHHHQGQAKQATLIGLHQQAECLSIAGANVANDVGVRRAHAPGSSASSISPRPIDA